MKIQRVARVVEPEDVQVTMSAVEASILVSVLMQIGGGYDGPRGTTDKILQGLRQIGVPRHNAQTKGSIYF